MNRAEQYCQTIKRMANAGGATPILPAEYQQVEYLESSGVQYINTGILSTTPIDYYIKAKWISQNVLFGAYGTNGRKFLTLATGSYGVPGIGYATSSKGGGYFGFNDPHELSGSLKPGNQTLYIDGVLQVSMNNTDTITPAQDMYLFAYRNEGGQIWGPISARVYSLIWTNNTKLLEYVPCYRKADNKPGMYDLVTNTFFTNAGTGEFVLGPNV